MHYALRTTHYALYTLSQQRVAGSVKPLDADLGNITCATKVTPADINHAIPLTMNMMAAPIRLRFFMKCAIWLICSLDPGVSFQKLCIMTDVGTRNKICMA